jgi:uncharacterized protein GlcG (DUF336 family)
MRDKKVLGLAEAQVAIQAMIEEAIKDPGKPMAIAIADDRGDIVSFVRMDGALVLYGKMAIKKAYTSAMMRRNTRAGIERRQKQVWGMLEPVRDEFTLIPGGVVITEPGETVVYGGIGASGRAADEDETLALVGLKALQDFLWPSP